MAFAEALSSYNTQPLMEEYASIDSSRMYTRQRNIDYIELFFDVSHSQMWGCPAGFGALNPHNQLRIRLTSNVFSDGNSALHSDLSFSQDVAVNGNELIPLGNYNWKETKLVCASFAFGLQKRVQQRNLCISPQYPRSQLDLS